MKKNELKALIKEAFRTEKKSTLLNENAPGFDNRKQGEPLPTLESIKAAYQAKKLEEKAEETKEETEATKELTAAVKDLSDAKKEAGLKEDKFVDAALEDLRTVINNLAHTSGMGKEEAAEMAMMHIEDMFMGGEEEEDMMQEGTPTVFDDKSMDDLLNIILKYVEDPADAEKELERFDAGGFEAMSDSVQANLDRDGEYKAWYNKLHSIEEEEVEEGVEKDYWADYTDIGMFYLDGLGMENTLTDDQFEKLGEKIVKQLYGGDVGKAYDDIVRGKKQRSGTELEEGEKVVEMVVLKSIGMMYDKDSKVLHPMKKDGTADLDVDVHVDDLDDEVHAKISDEDKAKLNESVIAEAKMEKELKHISTEDKKSKELNKIANELFPEIAKEQEGGKLVNFKPLSKAQRDEVYAEYAKLNESVIAEADMIVELFKK